MGCLVEYISSLVLPLDNYQSVLELVVVGSERATYGGANRKGRLKRRRVQLLGHRL
jgi:hypothetical protein